MYHNNLEFMLVQQTNSFVLDFECHYLQLRLRKSFPLSPSWGRGGAGRRDGVLNKGFYREAPPRGPNPYPFIYHF